MVWGCYRWSYLCFWCKGGRSRDLLSRLRCSRVSSIFWSCARTCLPEKMCSPVAILKEWTRQKAFSCFSMYGRVLRGGCCCSTLLIIPSLVAGTITWMVNLSVRQLVWSWFAFRVMSRGLFRRKFKSFQVFSCVVMAKLWFCAQQRKELQLWIAVRLLRVLSRFGHWFGTLYTSWRLRFFYMSTKPGINSIITKSLVFVVWFSNQWHALGFPRPYSW